MWQLEQTHKCAQTTTTLPLLNMDCVPSGGLYIYIHRYVDFTVGDVTNPGGMLCSPYQPFVVVLKKLFI